MEKKKKMKSKCLDGNQRKVLSFFLKKFGDILVLLPAVLEVDIHMKFLSFWNCGCLLTFETNSFGCCFCLSVFTDLRNFFWLKGVSSLIVNQGKRDRFSGALVVSFA